MKYYIKQCLLLLALVAFTTSSALAATLSDPRYNAPGNDSDNDGLPDNWETYQAGNLTTMDGGLTSGTPTDTDGDGYSDQLEFSRGWDPRVADTIRAEAQRRIPPMIEALTMPTQLQAGVTYRLSWKVMGYEGSYTTHVAMFDCTGIATKTVCGENYVDASRFFGQSVTPSLVSSAAWSYAGETASYFTYNLDFTVPATKADGVTSWDAAPAGTETVVRFYQKSNKASDAPKPSLSLLIPGGLSDAAGNPHTYYDTTGRRIAVRFVP